jgi:hypothetical protein
MSYPYAKYTMTYQEVVALDATIPEVLSFGDDTKDKTIRDMVMDMYWNYEIAGETIGEFRAMLTHSFGAIRDYYNELIDAYQTKIDMLEGRKTTTVIDGTDKTTESGKNDYSSNGTTDRDSNNTSNRYDLPRSTATENRPSGKIESNSSDDTSSSTSGNANYESSKTLDRDKKITITGGESVIKLKKEYMGIIKNIYRECANNLQKCFLDIFW